MKSRRFMRNMGTSSPVTGVVATNREATRSACRRPVSKSLG
jgi:hypothetical protein